MGSAGGRFGEQILYLVAGYLYFLPVFGDEPIRWRLSYPMKIALLVVSMPVDTFTGVALMQTSGPKFGMPAHDIHNGGAVMWIGGDFLMFVAILVVFAFWARHDTVRGAAKGGWLEAARASAITERTGAATEKRPDLDNDEKQLDAYNAWLNRLNEDQKT
jgi:cytochrome c oxidase assembly factor CtaG